MKSLQQTLQQNRALHRSTTHPPRHAADVELYSSTALYISTALQRSTLYILYTLPQCIRRRSLRAPSSCASSYRSHSYTAARAALSRVDGCEERAARSLTARSPQPKGGSCASGTDESGDSSGATEWRLSAALQAAPPPLPSRPTATRRTSLGPPPPRTSSERRCSLQTSIQTAL